MSGCRTAEKIPKPHNWGSHNVESFKAYRRRWPANLDHVPNVVIETWIYRHWREFQAWLPLNPLAWVYRLSDFDCDEIMSIGHVGDWTGTLRYWGDDLLDGHHRKTTRLGRFMLAQGTFPAPIIVAENAGEYFHPREGDHLQMFEPHQIVEGHMRLAYLQALVRRQYPSLKQSHSVIVATLP